MQMNSKILPVICLAAVWLAIPNSSAAENSLFVGECIKEDGVCESFQLKRYQFEDGVVRSATELLRLPVREVRLDLGANRVVQDRFALSHWGDVIDLRSRELLHEGRGEVIGVENNLVVHRVDRIDDTGVYVYDLDTGDYTPIEGRNKWSLPGVVSPDGLRSIEVSEWGSGEARLHTLDGHSSVLHSGLNVELSPLSNDLFGVAPVLWIDNLTVLTQEANGKLILLDTHGRIQRLLEIPHDEEPGGAPDLWHGPAGEVYYSLNSRVFRIDTETRRYVPVEWTPLGHGFEIEFGDFRDRGHRIRHDGSVIGEYWCIQDSAKTAPGYLAVEFGPVGSNLGYPAGVAVWNAHSNRWTELEIDWIHALIGWTNW